MTSCLCRRFDVFEASKAVTPNIAYFVPRNANVEQVRYYTDVTLYELHKYMSDFFGK